VKVVGPGKLRRRARVAYIHEFPVGQVFKMQAAAVHAFTFGGNAGWDMNPDADPERETNDVLGTDEYRVNNALAQCTYAGLVAGPADNSLGTLLWQFCLHQTTGPFYYTVGFGPGNYVIALYASWFGWPNQSAASRSSSRARAAIYDAPILPRPLLCRDGSFMNWNGSRATKRARFKRCVQGGRMDPTYRECLISAVGTAFGIGVGALIVKATARQLAGATIGGGAGGCLSAALRRL
jgi:hypothetical protein